MLQLHNDPHDMKTARTGWARGRLLRNCAAVYCASAWLQERFLQGVKRGREKVHVVYNGFPIPPLPAQKENLILFAGRMTEGKGALIFAQALALALPQLPGWRAAVIGASRHEASVTPEHYEREVERVVRSVAGAEWTGFLPHEEAMALFARASIVAVPSIWQEPFGRTALEGMALGAAVISSGRGGLCEVTADAALNLTEVTPETLAEAMLRLARDDAYRQSLQHKGRAQAERFSIAQCTKTLDAIRGRVLSQSHAG